MIKVISKASLWVEDIGDFAMVFADVPIFTKIVITIEKWNSKKELCGHVYFD